MKLEEVMEYTALLDEAEDFKPLVKKLIETIKSFSGEFETLIDEVLKYTRKKNIESFKFYIDNGMSRDEALALIINSNIALQGVLDKIKK